MTWTPFNFFKYDPTTHDFDSVTFNIKQALNNNWDHTKTVIEELREAVDLSTHRDINAVLYASKWDQTSKTYSFEETYPYASYDIEVEYGKTCTVEQVTAWSSAMLAGSIEDNVLTAIGNVPEVDIPIVIRIESKAGTAIADIGENQIASDEDVSNVINEVFSE